MTTIEKIKQARTELADAWAALPASDLDLEALSKAVDRMIYLQAEALRQATEVADENFARAQKLSDQVQENVRHIERLVGERGEMFTALVQALDGLVNEHGCRGDGWPDNSPEWNKARAALALAKGGAV